MSAAIDRSALRKDFPIPDQKVHGKPLVYLDNAATPQKPRPPSPSPRPSPVRRARELAFSATLRQIIPRAACHLSAAFPCLRRLLH